MTNHEAATKQCPHCAEEVLTEAKVCKHCGRQFSAYTKSGKRHTAVLLAVVLMIGAVVGGMALANRQTQRDDKAAKKEVCEWEKKNFPDDPPSDDC